MLGDERVRLEALIDRLLEHVESPIGVAPECEGLGEVELVVGVEL